MERPRSRRTTARGGRVATGLRELAAAILIVGASASAAAAEPRIDLPLGRATASSSVLIGTDGGSNSSATALAGCLVTARTLRCFASTPVPPSRAADAACEAEFISPHPTFRLTRDGRRARGYTCTGGILGRASRSPRLLRPGTGRRIGEYRCSLRPSARGASGGW